MPPAEPDTNPWAALALSRIASLPVDHGLNPSRGTIERELSRLREAQRPFLDMLNTGTYAPLLSLPDELIADILLYVRDARVKDRKPRCEDLGHRNVAPWYSFAHICRRLRSIALGTPMLWTDVSDFDGRPLLEEILPRSRGLRITLHLEHGTVLDIADLKRVSRLQLTGDVRDAQGPLGQPLPALETLWANTRSYPDFSTREFLPHIPMERIPPRLSTLHIDGKPFPWDCAIYDNLTHLQMACVAEPLTAAELRDLFSRMHRIHTIGLDGVDLLRTENPNDGMIELPSTLQHMFMSYERQYSTPRLPLRVHVRPGTEVVIHLSARTLSRHTTFQRDLLSRHIFEDPAHDGPYALSVSIGQDKGDSLWGVELGYWRTLFSPASPPLFALQLPFQSAFADEQSLLLERQAQRVTGLVLRISFPDDSDSPEQEYGAWARFFLGLSAVQELFCSLRTLEYVLSHAGLLDPDTTLADHPYHNLRVLHLQVDPHGDAVQADKLISKIGNWLDARRKVGLEGVDVRVEDKLREVLGDASIEELLKRGLDPPE
ncbi:unnamed protein product [Peniophora sp. CBMAI 1063]|nr:unnamed protein product [Peniophora sp. CBMAI 1063]